MLPPGVALPAVVVLLVLDLARVLADGSEEVEGELVICERNSLIQVGGDSGTGVGRRIGRHGGKLARFEDLRDAESIFTDMKVLIGRRELSLGLHW